MLRGYVETREPGEFRSDLATHFEFHAFAALSQVILKLSRGRKVSILMAGDGESVGGNFTKGMLGSFSQIVFLSLLNAFCYSTRKYSLFRDNPKLYYFFLVIH